MIAVECPQCGAATPAFPLTPDKLACRACNYVGPPRPEVLEQLRIAAHQIGSANAWHARQMDATRIASNAGLIRNRRRLHVVLVALALPAAGVAAFTAFAALGPDPNFTAAIIFGFPVLVFALAVLLASRMIDRQVRELTDACGAVPPAVAGGAARCHLCGADLPPATSASPICRCRHCGADNVASPELMRELLTKRHGVVGHLGRSLEQRGAFLARKSATAIAWVLVLVVTSPFAGCIGAFSLQLALDDVRLERVPADYVFVSFEGDVCVAYVDEKKPDGTWVLFAALSNGATMQEVPDAARYTHVKERWFVHQKMKPEPGDARLGGPVTDVYVHLLRPSRNQLRIATPPPNFDFVSTIEGRCFVDPPKNVVAYPWPRSDTAVGDPSARVTPASSPLAPARSAPKDRR